MDFYLTDANRLEAVKKVLKYSKNLDTEFMEVIEDICNKYVRYGTMSEKQEAMIARVYFIHCK